jgi:hypothetical protein
MIKRLVTILLLLVSIAGFGQKETIVRMKTWTQTFVEPYNPDQLIRVATDSSLYTLTHATVIGQSMSTVRTNGWARRVGYMISDTANTVKKNKENTFTKNQTFGPVTTFPGGYTGLGGYISAAGINFTPIWATGSATYDVLNINVQKGDHGQLSTLADWKINGVRKFSVNGEGLVYGKQFAVNAGDRVIFDNDHDAFSHIFNDYQNYYGLGSGVTYLGSPGGQFVFYNGEEAVFPIRMKMIGNDGYIGVNRAAQFPIDVTGKIRATQFGLADFATSSHYMDWQYDENDVNNIQLLSDDHTPVLEYNGSTNVTRLGYAGLYMNDNTRVYAFLATKDFQVTAGNSYLSGQTLFRGTYTDVSHYMAHMGSYGGDSPFISIMQSGNSSINEYQAELHNFTGGPIRTNYPAQLRTFTQADEPTSSDIIDGHFAFWIDTNDGDKLYMIYNQNDVIKKVLMQ